MQDVSDKYLLLEETEKQAVRKALVEERSRFCCFVSMLRPVVVSVTPQHPPGRPACGWRRTVTVLCCVCVSGGGDVHAGGDHPPPDSGGRPEDADHGPAQTARLQRTGSAAHVTAPSVRRDADESRVCLTLSACLCLQVIVDLKSSDCTWSYQTPPSSPSTTVSRKSSMCRLVTANHSQMNAFKSAQRH